MDRIQTDVERVAPAIVEDVTALPTAVIADVSDGAVVVGEDIRPVGDPSLGGTAVTVRAPPGDNRAVHQAATMAEAGDVLVVDADGYGGAGLWGELLSRSAMAHDLAGTVVDGAVRDVSAIRELGYPVYSRTVNPAGTDKRATGATNVPVTCGRRTVRPGSVVVGDADGVVCVDPDAAAEVRQAGREKLEREGALGDRVDDGAYLYDVLGLDDDG